jgi:hypothetical protein
MVGEAGFDTCMEVCSVAAATGMTPRPFPASLMVSDGSVMPLWLPYTTLRCDGSLA